MQANIIKWHISQAILRGDDKYSAPYFNNGAPVSLPNPQTSGTQSQRISYANSKASEIINNVNNK